MNKRFSLLFLFISLLFVPAFAQPNAHSAKLEKLDVFYEQTVKDWNIPGMTVGIVKDGKLLFAKGYGVKEIGKSEQPDPNTLYAIASNSKAFTSATIAMLTESGELDWNGKVQDYLPYFQLYDPFVSHEANLRDILSHRVGLGTFSGDVIWYKAEMSAEQIIRRIRHVPKAYDFRSGYGYSNLMYITAGEVIRTVTGKSWGQNVQEKILSPLGMDRSITTIHDLNKKGNYATPHAYEAGTNKAIPWVDWEIIAATGGIISSVNDLSKWMIFNLNHGIWEGDTLLSSKSRNLMWTPHNNHIIDHTKSNDLNRHFSSYGLGWGLSDYQGRLRVGHTGGYDGMITALTLIPDEDLGVVVLTNGMNSPIMAVTYQTLDAFLDAPATDWSADMLKARTAGAAKDTRIPDRQAKRVVGTKPALTPDACAGTYFSDIYGNITVSQQGDALQLAFEHSPGLSATLEHWHYDVWKINWNEPQAWFGFGTIKFDTDNNLTVTGLSFDVPNNDIFFEELKPRRSE